MTVVLAEKTPIFIKRIQLQCNRSLLGQQLLEPKVLTSDTSRATCSFQTSSRHCKTSLVTYQNLQLKMVKTMLKKVQYLRSYQPLRSYPDIKCETNSWCMTKAQINPQKIYTFINFFFKEDQQWPLTHRRDNSKP